MMAATSIAPPDIVHGDYQHASLLHSSTTAAGNQDAGLDIPPTYVALPNATKLEEEPNPFEKSFSDVSVTSRPVLPPVAAITTPPRSASKGIAAGQLSWDTLHTGILSPSMLSGPASTTFPQVSSALAMQNLPALVQQQEQERQLNLHQPQEQQEQQQQQQQQQPSQSSNNQICALKVTMYDRDAPAFINHTQDNPPTRVNRARARSDLANSSIADLENARKPLGRGASKRKSQSSRDIDDDDKRKNFLERNRQAALKCRQRKKLWLQDLQSKVEFLTVDNEQLQMQADALREEAMNFKTLLLAHKNCPVNQKDMLEAIQRPLPAYEPSLVHVDTTKQTMSGDQQHQQQRHQILNALTSQPSGAPTPKMHT